MIKQKRDRTLEKRITKLEGQFRNMELDPEGFLKYLGSFIFQDKEIKTFAEALDIIFEFKLKADRNKETLISLREKSLKNYELLEKIRSITEDTKFVN